MIMLRMQVLLPAAGISSGLQLSSLCPSSLLLQHSITYYVMIICSSSLANVSRMPIRANPLVNSLCGEQSSSIAIEQEPFAD
jgi:hypothetical protein